MQKPVLILGAGPAGLTAAHELVRRGIRCVVVEQSGVVGGIAQTVNFHGYRFDIGGHRFFTKISRVLAFWKEVLGPEMLTRPRLSRVYYRGKFFQYPIRPMDVLEKLGVVETSLCALSYIRSQAFKRRPEDSFEDYIINHFGERLFQTFFKTYTEKVWGIPCSTIKAAWAAQRIKDLSIATLVKNMLLRGRGNTIKTLIEEFLYPRLGPGMMWEAVRDRVITSGLAEVRLHTKPSAIVHAEGRIMSVQLHDAERNLTYKLEPSAVISSIAIRDLFPLFTPKLSADANSAAAALSYRDFITVALIIDTPESFPDTWIYIHDPGVKVGRIQNFRNWSPDMVPDARKTCLGLEYFCTVGDKFWSTSDADLIALAAKEVEAIGIAKAAHVLEGTVVRMPKAYPVYDDAYQRSIACIQDTVNAFSNLYAVGRNGMHKYNNQDHSMLTAMLAVENLLDGARHDLWAVNVDQEYHEEVSTHKQASPRTVPLRDAA